MKRLYEEQLMMNSAQKRFSDRKQLEVKCYNLINEL